MLFSSRISDSIEPALELGDQPLEAFPDGPSRGLSAMSTVSDAFVT